MGNITGILRNPWVWGAIALLVIAAVAVWWLKKSGKLMAKFIHPVPGSRVSSPYGMRTHPITRERKLHNGVDFAAPTGTMILSPAKGRVTRIWEDSINGKALRIQHDNGYTTGYAHLHLVLVDVGEIVSQGEPIGQVGNTGRSTGPHLHFTMERTGGAKFDPLPLLT